MQDTVSLIIQLITGVLATIAAVASAIAAWQARTTANNALHFQKKLSKHQDDLFLLKSAISKLWQLKRIIEAPLAADDSEFESFNSIHRDTCRNLESLIQNGAINRSPSMFFDMQTRADAFDNKLHAVREIDIEIKRLEAKIDEILS